MSNWLLRVRGMGWMCLTWAAGWAAAGLLLSLVPAAMVSVGLADLNRPNFSLWKLTALICGPLTVLAAVSGAAALRLARMARLWRKLLLQLLASE